MSATNSHPDASMTAKPESENWKERAERAEAALAKAEAIFSDMKQIIYLKDAALAKARDEALSDVESTLLTMVKLHTASVWPYVYGISAWPHVHGVEMALNMVRNLRGGTK